LEIGLNRPKNLKPGGGKTPKISPGKPFFGNSQIFWGGNPFRVGLKNPKNKKIPGFYLPNWEKEINPGEKREFPFTQRERGEKP